MIIDDPETLRTIVTSQAAVVFFVRETDPEWGDQDLATGVESRGYEKLAGITYRFTDGDYWEQVLRISCNVATAAFSRGKLLHLSYGPIPFITIPAIEAAMSMIHEIMPVRTIARRFAFLGHEHEIRHEVQDLGLPYETYLVSDEHKIENANEFEAF